MPRRNDKTKHGRNGWETRKQRKRRGHNNEGRHARLKEQG